MSNKKGRAKDLKYIVASTRGEIEHCAVWLPDKEHAASYAKERAQRDGWAYEVFEVRKIGLAEPTDAAYTHIDVRS